MSIWTVLQKELEKELKKVVDKQTELSTDIQTMRKDMNSEFEKHNSNQITYRKQLQVKKKYVNLYLNVETIYLFTRYIFKNIIIIISYKNIVISIPRYLLKKIYLNA